MQTIITENLTGLKHNRASGITRYLKTQHLIYESMVQYLTLK